VADISEFQISQIFYRQLILGNESRIIISLGGKTNGNFMTLQRQLLCQLGCSKRTWRIFRIKTARYDQYPAHGFGLLVLVAFLRFKRGTTISQYLILKMKNLEFQSVKIFGMMLIIGIEEDIKKILLKI